MQNWIVYLLSTSWPLLRLCPKLLLICIDCFFFNLFLNPLFKYKWPVATTTFGSHISNWSISRISNYSTFLLCQFGISQAAYTATFVPGLKTGFSITYVNSWNLSFVPETCICKLIHIGFCNRLCFVIQVCKVSLFRNEWTK